jgi:hypothetical protein
LLPAHKEARRGEANVVEAPKAAMTKVEKSMMRGSTGLEPNLQRVNEQAQGGEEKKKARRKAREEESKEKRREVRNRLKVEGWKQGRDDKIR